MEISKRLEEINRSRPTFKADMRRSQGFAVGEYIPAIACLEQYCCEEKGRHREAFYLTAMLYAIFPQHVKGKPFALVMAESDEGNKEGSANERRFRRLLSSDWEQLARVLPREINILGQQGKGFDYDQLHKDLQFWGSRVVIRWAEQFYNKKSEVDNESLQA